MTKHPITGDQRFVKSINRNVLLRLLMEEPAQSRSALAERSGLTKSTVGLLTKELLEEGWLIEDSVAATGSLGRRPTPLRIAGRGLVLIGAELGIDSIRVVSTSLNGLVQDSQLLPLHDRSPDVVCHQLVELVTSVSARVTSAGVKLLGIGVALPGAVDATSGVIEFAPNLGWRNVDVGRRLARELAVSGLGQVPVYCHNEADVAAIGETSFGSRPIDDPLVFVSCGVGVGAGIVLHGALFAGSTGAAGEIGHNILHIDGLPCSCGRRGCAEAYVGLKGVAQAAGALHHGEVDRAKLLAQLAGARAQRTSKAFASAGSALGVMLQNVWTTFNPKVIVLGGESVTIGGAHFLDSAVDRLTRFGIDAGSTPPQIRTAKYGDLAAAVGGAAYALHALLEPFGSGRGASKVRPV